MNAVAEPIAFALPKKPRIKEKDAPPDQRKVCVMPIRAINDSQVTDGMFRVLSILCSYCNRAGLTWVSQKRLAEDYKVSQQAISKQLTKLQAAGYVEIVRKGFRGERSNTVRVIFDPTVSAEDAIAMTSNKEDTRPPSMQEEIDPEGQRRVAQLIAKALKQPTKPKGHQMPAKGQTRTVQKMKDDIAQAKAKRSKPVEKTVDNSSTYTTPEVVHVEAPHSQPNEAPYTTSYTTSEVVRNTKNTYIDKELKDIGLDKVNNKSNVLNNLEVSDFDLLIEAKMKPEQIEDALVTLLPLFAAEGLTPTSKVLADSILQLHRDSR